MSGLTDESDAEMVDIDSRSYHAISRIIVSHEKDTNNLITGCLRDLRWPAIIHGLIIVVSTSLIVGLFTENAGWFPVVLTLIVWGVLSSLVFFWVAHIIRQFRSRVLFDQSVAQLRKFQRQFNRKETNDD